VIGGGLLGLETAGALARQGAQVHVLENAGWLLPRQLNEAAGNLLKTQVEKMGIVVHTNARTRELVGDDQVRGVLLEDGTCLPADLVVISAGVRANLNLARQAGIQVNQGILVDDSLQTSHPHVFAAGDVCEHRSTLYGTWPPAQQQGSAAGRSAAGQPGHFGGVPRSTALKVLGYEVFSIGKFNPESPADLQVAAETDGGYACFVFRDGRMLGAILLGSTHLSGEVKQAVETGRDFSNRLRTNPDVTAVMRMLTAG
jgi:nitrite reductase (NADH) large subunit